mgnify:CR=1 FL=1
MIDCTSRVVAVGAAGGVVGGTVGAAVAAAVGAAISIVDDVRLVGRAVTSWVPLRGIRAAHQISQRSIHRYVMGIGVDLSPLSTLEPSPLAETEPNAKQNAMPNTRPNTKASPHKRVSGNRLESSFGNALPNKLQNRLRQYLGSAAWLSREVQEKVCPCIHWSKPSLVTVAPGTCVLESAFEAVFKVKG